MHTRMDGTLMTRLYQEIQFAEDLAPIAYMVGGEGSCTF